MKIRLDNTLPEPLADGNTRQSQVWNTQLEFNQGDIAQVQAVSGRGKSTLIQIIYGNRKDYTGAVYLDEQPIRKLSHSQWAALRQKKLSIVFQDLRLFPDLNGQENLQLKLRLTKFYAKEKELEMAERLGVSGLLNKKCGLMSYGERQRFAIIRALLQPFDWLLMDEPFSHLDKNNTAKAAELITEEAAKRNAGILVACLNEDHDLKYNRRILL